MSDGTSAGGPPPGWLYDSNTQQTRWWDGTRWTEHVQRTEPAYQHARVAPQQSTNQAAYSQPQTYGSFSYAAAPLTSKNGPAKASLILILLLVLGVGAILWLLTGADPAMQLVFGVLNILMVIAAFILAIIGLVIAVRRPTRKRESVFALVVSSLMLVAIVGFMIFTANQLDVPGLESQIEAWATAQTGEAVNVACPPNPPSGVGDVFSCTATGATGSSYVVNVTMLEESMVTWEIVPP
ncbi:DUF2510 domain-containing protein [Microbacterium sp. NPDC064584]|uniref:DUF4333 domain-containing protein n=1 Tax=Microbacterium sp. NPDC064584 TaxID=3155817 RepID=UPI0034401468